MCLRDIAVSRATGHHLLSIELGAEVTEVLRDLFRIFAAYTAGMSEKDDVHLLDLFTHAHDLFLENRIKYSFVLVVSLQLCSFIFLVDATFGSCQAIPLERGLPLWVFSCLSYFFVDCGFGSLSSLATWRSCCRLVNLFRLLLFLR